MRLMFHPRVRRCLVEFGFVALRDAQTIDALYVRARWRLSAIFSTGLDRSRVSKVKVDNISTLLGATSQRRSLAQRATILSRPCQRNEAITC